MKPVRVTLSKVMVISFKATLSPCMCGGVVRVLAASYDGVSAWPTVETSQIAVAGLPKSEE